MTTEEPTEPDPTGGEALAGRYRVGSLIGSGGMGRVWNGVDELLGRDVAIKELTFPAGLARSDRAEMRTRMLREARTAAKLSHPSIVTIYDVVEFDDRPWIIMELVRARSLADLARESGGLAQQRIARLGLQLAEALRIAHARGVVHRDVKPANVLVTETDRAVLTDFGIAVLDGDSTLTRTGVLVGSPAYLAPECAFGEPARPASDLWSLGATLYAAAYGHAPFQRSGAMATLSAIVNDEVPDLSSTGPLRPVLQGLLRKAPDQRMSGEQTCQALREAAVWSPAEPVAAPSTPVAPAPPPADRARSARAWRTGLIAAAVVAVGAGGVGIGLLSASQLPSGTQSAAGPSSSSAADPADSPSGDPSPSESPAPTGPPEGFERYEDSTGFALNVPEGWSVEREGSSVYFHDPGGGYLLVDQTDDPGTDARADWMRQEDAISANFPGYERVSIEDIHHPNLEPYVSAADWEFTYDSSEHGRMRAVNRAFHSEEKGYALFLTGPDNQWGEYRELLDEFTASFEPG